MFTRVVEIYVGLTEVEGDPEVTMTAWSLTCPGCSHVESLKLQTEDTFMSLGPRIAENTYQMREQANIAAFVAAQVAFSMLEESNKKIEWLASECERLSDALSNHEPSLTERSEELGPFVASQYRNRFHRPECSWAEYFLHSSYCEVFDTHEEAVAAGKRPCHTCCA